MKKLLLHICCGPCAPYVFLQLQSHFTVTGFFYNPNIHPQEEYEFRRRELEKAAQRSGWEIIFSEYDHPRWQEEVKGWENEPERGRRCEICFYFRLKKAFAFAGKHGYSDVATTLSISPHKNAAQINSQGQRLAAEFGIGFLAVDFKKKNGYQIGRKMAGDLQIRHQHYCGCEFSLPKPKTRP